MSRCRWRSSSSSRVLVSYNGDHVGSVGERDRQDSDGHERGMTTGGEEGGARTNGEGLTCAPDVEQRCGGADGL